MIRERRKSEITELEHLLEDVEKPGRYIGGEWNEKKKDPSRVRAKVGLVFPDLYEVGMSYLGQKILYSLLNDHPHILAERVYAPWLDFEHKLREAGRPLYSLENRIPLGKLDILGFSLLHELNFSNILTILDLGRIPLFSSERDSGHPMVIAGGPAAFNPEPVAEFFDLFLIGDGEEAFLEIIEKYVALKEHLTRKSDILKELAKIKGVYVPSLYETVQPPGSFPFAVRPKKGAPEKIEKRTLFPFHEAPFPEAIVVPSIKVIFDRVAVEVARGCDQKCRFCQAGFIYFPPRVKSPSSVLKTILNSLRLTGYEDTSLASLSISDYPYLERTVRILMEELARRRISLSLPSLRPKGLSSKVASEIIKVRKTGFTIVPEAGTERLRRIINKKLDDDEIFEAARNAFSQGWNLLKLYFMVGLPAEREEDLEGIVRLVEEVIRVGYRTLRSPPQINLSVASFIPKPHTPFQWLKMEEEDVLREKHRYLRFRLKKYPFVRLKKHPVKSALLEAVFSRGDRRLNRVLHQAWSRGARFDSWTDQFRFDLWQESFERERLDYHCYLSSLDRDAPLPWDHIDTGVKKSYLLKELARAMREKTTPSCWESRCEECRGCQFPALLERKFSEAIQIPDLPDFSLGKETGSIVRYRVFYSKLGQARFLSHMDLNNILQRAFRRAGIPVAYSEGFHPKMIISHPAALPLGMEGKAECFEFKSRHLFQEREFRSRLNASLPEGVRILRLKRMDGHKPSLNEEIEALVYSVDLKREEVREAAEALCTRKKFHSSGVFQCLERLVRDFLSTSRNEMVRKISINRKEEKLFLHILHSPGKNVSASKIVENAIQMKNAAFFMAREKIVFTASKN